MVRAFVPLQGWTLAATGVSEPRYELDNLRPNTTYMFLVRARNSHGLSLPSPVTEPVRTAGQLTVIITTIITITITITITTTIIIIIIIVISTRSCMLL